MSLIKSLKTGTGLTTNGATTNLSSLNKCLDLFFIAGASRNMGERDVINMFQLAMVEDAITAIKILFWARDVRGGAGERRFFRIIFSFLKRSYGDRDLARLMKLIPEYGRWDDLWADGALSNEVLQYIADSLNEKNQLLAKWLPRKGDIAKQVAKFMKLSARDYRKLIVGLTSVVETQMCNRQRIDINYKSIPSQAFQKYKAAYERNDNTRFTNFISEVAQGKTILNSSTLYPYQLYNSWSNGENNNVINEQWKLLSSKEFSGSVLPVVDTSGSMEGTPMSMSISLGVYLSERINGPFKNTIITFEGKPKLYTLPEGAAVCDKFRTIKHWISDCSTNIQGVFDLILGVATRDNLPQSDMPEKIVIISDMEFNSVSGSNTNFQEIKRKYEEAGYNMPFIIFWNVNGREGNVPAQSSDYVGLISGASSSIVESVMSGDFFSPVEMMLKTLNNSRYDLISEVL